MMTTIVRLLDHIKNTNRDEWVEHWISFADDWSTEEGIPPQSPGCYHTLLEALLTACDSWNNEEQFTAKLWDLARTTQKG